RTVAYALSLHDALPIYCEDLEKAVATNVLGPFRLTKALLGALSASVREGRAALVINISSDAAVTPYPKWGAYGASKAALRIAGEDRKSTRLNSSHDQIS